MKNNVKVVLAALALCGALGLTACGSVPLAPSAPSVPAEPVSTPPAAIVEKVDSVATPSPRYGAKAALYAPKLEEADAVRFALQEEYMSRAKYSTAADRLGNIEPFASIAKAEEERVKTLEQLAADLEIQLPEDKAAQYMNLQPTTLGLARDAVQSEIDKIEMYSKFTAMDFSQQVQDAFSLLRDQSVGYLEQFQQAARQPDSSAVSQ